MLKLLKKLKIPTHKFTSSVTSLLPNKFNMKEAVAKIKLIYNKNKNNVTNLSMKEFLINFFGKDFAKEFIANCEYHDFLESDVSYFIKYYKIDDMIHMNDTIYGLKWQDLVDRLVHYKKIKDFFCKVGVKIKIKDFHFCPFRLIVILIPM